MVGDWSKMAPGDTVSGGAEGSSCEKGTALEVEGDFFVGHKTQGKSLKRKASSIYHT